MVIEAQVARRTPSSAQHADVTGDHPVWFGSASHPLFGFVHVPQGEACTGAAILVPPLGYEHVVAHRTLRVLAEQLSGRGVAVLRYDHAATGDSSGWFRDGGLAEAWVRGVREGTDLLRRCGAPSVVAVAMRAGALFATAASAAGGGPDGLVLWDPVVKGSSLVREWRMLQGLAPPDPSAPGDEPASALPTPGDFEVAGARYSSETLDALAQMEVQPDLALRTLVLARSDRPDRQVRRHLGSWTDLTWADAEGQDRLIDAESSTAVVPLAAVSTIVRWVEGVGGSSVPFGAPEATGGQVVDGPLGPVLERPVRLGRLGLFAMVASPTDGAAAGPVAVALNNAADYHIGPARMWVEWGRVLAAQGWTVVRLDIPGVGDSPTPPGYADDHAYPAKAAADVAEVLDEAGYGRGSLLIGLCSGGRHALDVAGMVGARCVVAINSSLHIPASALTEISPANPYPATVARFDRQQLRWRLRALVPKGVARRWGMSGRGAPLAAPLHRLTNAATDVVLVYGSGEFNLTVARRSCSWLIDDLRQSRASDVIVVDGLDHALMGSVPRRALATALSNQLSISFGGRPPLMPAVAAG